MARKDLPSPTAPNFLARVREEVHALLGKLGNGSDRALTLRDAIESGVIVPGPGGSLIPGPGAGAAEEPDLTPPPQPDAFAVTGAISHFLISQAPPFYTQGHGHSRTVVYGAQWVSGPLPVFADAVELDRFAGTVRAVASNPATTWRLWIKWESNDGVLSATPAGGTNGLAVTTGQDVALLLDALAGQITSTELASSLSTPIGQIPSISGIASEALAKANSNLAAIGTIQTELAELSGTPDYDNAATYELDDIVKYSGGLYRALGTTTGNLPTNTTYWQKIGDYASLVDAVSAHAAQLSDHETRITDAEGDLTAEATARETLATQLRGSYAGTDIAMVSAGLIHSERQARSMADSTEVSARQALSAKLTGAADPASLTLGTLSSGLLYDELQARAFNDAAQVARIETMETAVNSPSTGLATKASLTQLSTVESNAAGALATAQTTLNSTIAGLGGENLYTGADPLVAGPGVYGITGEILKDGDANPYKLVPGEKLTISAELWRDAAAASDGSASVIYFVSTKLDGTWTFVVGLESHSMTPERQVATLQLPASAEDMVRVIAVLYHQVGATNTTGTVAARRIQIERGSVATAYKIGLRNASAAITTLQQTQASQGLSIGSLTTAVQTAQNTADSKASTSYVDSVEARVDTVEGTVSSQGTLISGLSSDLSDLTGVVGTKANASALTETNTNVSNLSGTVSAQAGQITTLQSQVIGGSNQVKNSEHPDGYDPIGGIATKSLLTGQTLPDGSSGSVVRIVTTTAVTVRIYRCVKQNGKHSAQMWCRAVAGAAPVTLDICDRSPSKTFTPTEEWSFQKLEGVDVTNYSYEIYNFFDIALPAGITFDIWHLQVELGDKATGWGPSGDDLYSAVQVEATTRATQTGELYAQYTVKTDVGGLVSGYGLASSAVNAAPTSAFGVQAGQFFAAPPAVSSATAPTAGLFKGFAWRDTTTNTTKYWTGIAWSTTPQTKPFVVQTVPEVINGFTVEPGVYADNAFFARLVATRGQIGLLAVDDARIADLSVSKLTAGSIAVGQFAQSTGYVAGSAGWRINGDGTAEFSGVVVRGTIFASQGAIGGWTIGSNYLQSTTYVLGDSGTRLNSDGTGQIGGLTVLADKVRNTAYSDFFEGFELGGNGVIRAYSNTGQNVLNTGATGTDFFIKAGNSFVLRANGDLSTTGRVQSADGRTYFDPKASGSSPVFLVRNSAFFEKVRIEAGGRAVFNDVVISRPNIVASGTWTRPAGMPAWDISKKEGIWEFATPCIFVPTGYSVLEDVLQQGGPSFVGKALVTGTYMSPSQPGDVIVYRPRVSAVVVFQADHYVSGSAGTPGGEIVLRLDFDLPIDMRSNIAAIRYTSINWSVARLT